MAERIAKVIARAGLCSRREAEKLIAAGRVSLDGESVTSPATTVGPDNRVTVDGAAVPVAPASRLWLFHKPQGVLTTERDPQGRRTIYDILPDHLPRVMPVGRLDLNSEGLLLLTNDGALKRRLELPSTGWRRRYRVRVHGRPDSKLLAGLARGIVIDGIEYQPIEAVLDKQAATNAWLSMSLTEGKNREIRKLCEHLGLRVNRLIRLAFGPFQLGRLPAGGLKEVSGKVLREQLGSASGQAAARPAAKRARVKITPAKKQHPRQDEWRQKPTRPGEGGVGHAGRRR